MCNHALVTILSTFQSWCFYHRLNSSTCVSSKDDDRNGFLAAWFAQETGTVCTDVVQRDVAQTRGYVAIGEHM